jgi:NTP pyrophosphatase (non-canonical NTP hydrolase)
MTYENLQLNESKSQSLGWIEVTGGQQIRYDEFVRKLFKPANDFWMLAHAVMGVTGEAGELCDAIKKHIIYGKELDRTNVVEELGDLRFYMQAVQNIYGISEQEVLQHNACKLMVRYEGLEYSDAAAQARADKVGD